MEAPRTHAQRPQWFWIAAIWSAIGLFDATQTVFSMRAEGMHHAWNWLFLTLLIEWLPWALATPIVLHLGGRFPATQLKPLSTWVRHLAACIAIDLAFSAWSATLEKLTNPYADAAGPGKFLHLLSGKFYGGLLSTFILYATVLMVSYLLDSRERLARQQTEAARLNEQLMKAQLTALRRQIEPHFLFNTLNSIAGLVREKRNEAAVTMIVELSDFMRRVLEDSNRQQVPLGEELEFTRKYLEIQKVRFVERLQCTMNVPSELLPAQVPMLILQPIVENAIKHGIAKRVQGGAVRILASRSNGMLTLSVYNDGPSLPATSENIPSGIGISNMRTRLQSLYGDNFTFDMQNQGLTGVEVSVSVPFKDAPLKDQPASTKE
jgi:two-component system, LytTR family, sensor kinase